MTDEHPILDKLTESLENYVTRYLEAHKTKKAQDGDSNRREMDALQHLLDEIHLDQDERRAKAQDDDQKLQKITKETLRPWWMDMLDHDTIVTKDKK